MSMEQNKPYEADMFNEIRSRSGEDKLDKKLRTVWLTEGYSKNSVKEYITFLQKELNYQKQSFEIQLKGILDEKERLISEKNILTKQLEEAVEMINNSNRFEEHEHENEAVIDQLKLENEENKKNLNEYYELIGKLRGQIAEANEEIENLKNNAVSADGDENVALLNEARQEISILNEQKDILQEEVNSLNAKIENMSITNKYSAELDNDSKNELIKIQAEENSKLINEKQSLVQEVASISKVLQDMVNKEKLNNQKIVDISSKFDQEFESKRREIFQYKEELQKVMGTIHQKDIENNDLKAQLMASIDIVSELKDKVEYFESANSILQKQLDEQREKNRKMAGINTSVLKDRFVNHD